MWCVFVMLARASRYLRAVTDPALRAKVQRLKECIGKEVKMVKDLNAELGAFKVRQPLVLASWMFREELLCAGGSGQQEGGVRTSARALRRQARQAG
jgi:hypothetical protein